MKCRDAQPWLLASRPDESLPLPIDRHLRTCDTCRTLWLRLASVHKLATPADHRCVTPASLLKRIADTAQVVPATELPMPVVSRQRAYPRRLPAVHRLLMAVCVMAGMVSLFLIIGRWSNSTIAPPTPAIARQPKQAGYREVPNSVSLLVRVAGRGSKLAEQSSPAARAETFSEISDELRAECFRLARGGQLDELTRLTRLHDRVLRDGILPQALQCKGPDRDAVNVSLAAHFSRAERQVADSEKQSLPTVAERLRPLAISARLAARLLREQRLDRSGVAPAAGTLIDELITQSLRLSDEQSPLNRAAASADMADVLAQVTVMLSVSGSEADTTRLGEYLETVMTHGVADNLDRVEEEDAAGTHRDEIVTIRRKAEGVGTVLERNLSKAPPAAQFGLQRAWDASQQGRQRAAFGGKGKGHGAKDRMPPGLQKKLDKTSSPVP